MLVARSHSRAEKGRQQEVPQYCYHECRTASIVDYDGSRICLRPTVSDDLFYFLFHSPVTLLSTISHQFLPPLLFLIYQSANTSIVIIAHEEITAKETR